MAVPDTMPIVIGDLPRSDRRASGASIAVLAFADMSPGRDQEYFCDGLADELISYLGALDGVRVASRIAAFQYKGKAADVAEIGQRLNVATILEGSVRKAGNRLRITVQLTDVRDGRQLWSERYDRDLDDVFAIQDEIARAIVEKMRGQLSRGDLSGIMDQRSRRRTDDPDAYQSYLRGRFHWNQRTPGVVSAGDRPLPGGRGARPRLRARLHRPVRHPQPARATTTCCRRPTPIPRPRAPRGGRCRSTTSWPRRTRRAASHS